MADRCRRWAALLAAVALAAAWIGHQQNWHWLDVGDQRILGVLHDYGVKHPGWVSFWSGFSDVFHDVVLAGLALIPIAIALFRRHFRVAGLLAGAVVASLPVTGAVKALVGRPRPVTRLVAENSTSFPSGHSLTIMAATLAFGTVAWPLLSHRWRIVASVAGLLIVLLVGFARVALNVHHPSDVIAGWSLGFLWYLLWVTFLPPWPVTASPEAKTAV